MKRPRAWPRAWPTRLQGRGRSPSWALSITWDSTNPTGYVSVSLYKDGMYHSQVGYVPMADGSPMCQSFPQLSLVMAAVGGAMELIRWLYPDNRHPALYALPIVVCLFSGYEGFVLGRKGLP